MRQLRNSPRPIKEVYNDCPLVYFMRIGDEMGIGRHTHPPTFYSNNGLVLFPLLFPPAGVSLPHPNYTPNKKLVKSGRIGVCIKKVGGDALPTFYGNFLVCLKIVLSNWQDTVLPVLLSSDSFLAFFKCKGGICQLL